MAADACLPNLFTKQNAKGSYPRIVLAFFILCSSILLITGGDLLSLAGVYTISFLGVMSLFALGNLILKETRTELKRTYSAPIPFVVLAFFATVLGIIGNIFIDKQNLLFFLVYFIPAVLIVLVIVYQDYAARYILRLTKNIPILHRFIGRQFEDMTDGKFLVFIHHVNRLYTILNYINKNETGWNIVLVHCHNIDKKEDKAYRELEEALPKLKEAGVFPHLNIDLVHKKAEFGPEIIRQTAKEFKIRLNRVLIGSIHHEHPYDYDELGGVRIIF